MTASIRTLPSTWADRSIVIPLQRKPKREVWGRKAKALPIFVEINRRCARWVTDNLDALKAADPAVPQELDDRAGQQNWAPLFAIADLASPAWSLKARHAAIHLSGAAVRKEQESWGIRLLSDLRDLFNDLGRVQLGSKEVCAALKDLEERPWAEWGPTRKPITPIPLSNLLKPFRIYPKSVEIPGGQKPNGYHLKDCIEAFGSYLDAAKTSSSSETAPENDFQKSETLKHNATNGFRHFSQSLTDEQSDFHKTPIHPTERIDSDSRTFETSKRGDCRKKGEMDDGEEGIF